MKNKLEKVMDIALALFMLLCLFTGVVVVITTSIKWMLFLLLNM